MYLRWYKYLFTSFVLDYDLDLQSIIELPLCWGWNKAWTPLENACLPHASYPCLWISCDMQNCIITMTPQWARWRLRSLASRLFTQPFIQTQIGKYQSSASLAFVRGIHRGPVNSPHKGPVTRKILPFDDVIMINHFMNMCLYIHEKQNVYWISMSMENPLMECALFTRCR